ncbi:Hypothetical protein GLP15_3876 [Giardia lamblia P15]|uniref:Uncharacterized protein n=1 Tax=Giardia intestinalis (strain P15) TaxID=658858 RepID=E1F198_GIAIA|nr:Hypothetical protein GLP15_3876 [Giardia lamblia P15]
MRKCVQCHTDPNVRKATTVRIQSVLGKAETNAVLNSVF